MNKVFKDNKEYAESYQPLFDILHDKGLIPLQSELDEIIYAVELVKKNQSVTLDDEKKVLVIENNESVGRDTLNKVLAQKQPSVDDEKIAEEAIKQACDTFINGTYSKSRSLEKGVTYLLAKEAIKIALTHKDWSDEDMLNAWDARNEYYLTYGKKDQRTYQEWLTSYKQSKGIV